MEEPLEILEKLRDEGEDAISTSDLKVLQTWADHLSVAANEGSDRKHRYFLVTSIPVPTTGDPIRDRRLAHRAPRKRPRAAKLELIARSNYSNRISLGLVSSRAEVRELVADYESNGACDYELG